MNRTHTYDIAVVGAGMVGAATALLLTRAGFEVVVIEPREAPVWRAETDVGLRVVALAPSSVDCLQRLQLWSRIRGARACAYRHMHVWDALTPGELNFDASDTGAAELGWIVENALIQHILWQALRSESRLDLRCPARVNATAINSASRALTLDDGTRLAARLVLAADGADSPLRAMVGIDTRDRDYAQRAIVAHVATERPHQATAWQRFVPGGTVALLPLADGRSSLVWSVPQHEAGRLLSLDDKAFCDELGAAFDYRLGRVTASTARASFPLRMRHAQTYLGERFALVGDAAHVVHPLAGQGVNLGFRDTHELTRVLIRARDAGRDFASPANLRRYERTRRSDNMLSATGFDVIQRVFANPAMPVAALRGVGLAAIERFAPLKRLFALHAAGR